MYIDIYVWVQTYVYIYKHIYIYICSFIFSIDIYMCLFQFVDLLHYPAVSPFSCFEVLRHFYMG